MDNKRNNFATRGIILMYHRVADLDIDTWSLAVSPRHFSEQMEVVRQIFHPIRLTDLSQAKISNNIAAPWVAITFDDGYADNYHTASTILKQYNIPATFFLVSGYLGSRNGYWWDELQDLFLQPGKLPNIDTLRTKWDITDDEWDNASSYSKEDHQQTKNWCWDDEAPTSRHSLFRKIYFWLRTQSEEQRQTFMKKVGSGFGSESDNKPKRTLFSKVRNWGLLPGKQGKRQLLTTEEAIALNREDLFDIGAHTVTHQDLAAIPKSLQENEIITSKKSLEKIFGNPIRGFSYSYGSFTPDTIEIVRRAGFNYACTTMEGFVDGNSDLFCLPRMQVKDWEGELFARKLLSHL